MNDPKNRPQRSATKTLGVGPRGSSALALVVKQRVGVDAAWSQFAVNGKWLCPFCLAAVSKRSGRSRDDSLAMHLETCRSYANGRGNALPIEQVAVRMQFENMITKAESDPAWRVYDHEGVWFCPVTLERVASVRLQGGQLNNFVFQAMAAYLARHPGWQRGAVHGVDAVQRVRDRMARLPALTQSVRRQLQNAAWRYLIPDGSWICPCCLGTIVSVRIARAEDWTTAPDAITRHLLFDCPAYREDQLQLHTEADVRRAAAAAISGRSDAIGPAPMPPPSSASRRAIVAPAQPPALPTSQSPSRSSQSPSPVPPPRQSAWAGPPSEAQRRAAAQARRAAQPGHTATPPVATPPPIATPVRNRAVGTGSRIIAGRDVPLPPAPPPPAAAPIPAAEAPGERPVDQGDLGGGDGSTFLDILAAEDSGAAPAIGDGLAALPGDEAIAAGGDDDAVDSGSGRHADDDHTHFNWMDHAEEVAEAAESTEHLERTDVVRARALQKNLMQDAPAIPGFAFATRYEACSDISGDFYTFIRLPDGRVGIALGDVSGHGVQAGLVMSMAKKTLEIYASTGRGPAEVLAQVNDSLCGDLGGKLFISMFYCILAPEARTLTWVRAGHNPCLHYNRASGVMGEIKPRGMVVGMKTGAIFRNSLEEQVTDIASGDLFVLYTDGITETMNRQQEEFGTERLMEVTRQCAGDGPDMLLGQIMDRIRHFRGSEPANDDATLLAVAVS